MHVLHQQSSMLGGGGRALRQLPEGASAETPAVILQERLRHEEERHRHRQAVQAGATAREARRRAAGA